MDLRSKIESVKRYSYTTTLLKQTILKWTLHDSTFAELLQRYKYMCTDKTDNVSNIKKIID